MKLQEFTTGYGGKGTKSLHPSHVACMVLGLWSMKIVRVLLFHLDGMLVPSDFPSPFFLPWQFTDSDLKYELERHSESSILKMQYID